MRVPRHDALLARCIDVVLDQPAARRLRAEVAGGASGRVMEIGFGSGTSLEHLGAGVEQVLAVEPSPTARHLAEPRIAAADVAVEWAGDDAQSLDLADSSVDTVVVCWTLCTIPDPLAALREARRVLRPDGTLRFVEHGLHPADRVRRWQRRIEPLWKPLAGGCHLTREPSVLVEAAGFRMVEVRSATIPGPSIATALTVGVAARS